MFKINCDIGERGAQHPIDDEIMKHIDIANIACGGHAGNVVSVAWYMTLANEYDVEVVAHLSYPDKENFGRKTMTIALPDLKKSLDNQMKMISTYQIKKVKFHGALYNDTNSQQFLASNIALWAANAGITEVITDDSGKLAQALKLRGIKVIPEYFAERNYLIDDEGKVSIAPRNLSIACISKLSDAVAHSRRIIINGIIGAYKEVGKTFVLYRHELNIGNDSTICVHSDSPIAVDLIKELKNIIKP